MPGLRERKKAETRASLSRAALRLATEQGADRVTAEAIAEAANVSVRTFHNYFTSKDEAFLDPFRTVLEHAVEQFRARPVDEPALDSLELIWGRLATGEAAVPDDTLAQVAVLWASPLLAVYRHRVVADAISRFAPAIAERSGTDPDRDLYPTFVTTIAVTTIFSALEHPAAETLSPDERMALVHEGFQLVRSGLRPPRAARQRRQHTRPPRPQGGS